MKILVLGSSGQIGLELMKALNRHSEILSPSRRDLDLTNLEQVARFLHAENPDCIVNAAAYTKVDQAETEIEAAYKLNHDLPTELALFCRDSGARLVHFSTDYVFSGQSENAWDEIGITRPINVYGRSKLAGEHAIEALCEKYFILRTSWVFSAHGSNFVKTMVNMATTREKINVVTDQTGIPTSARFLATTALATLQHGGFGLYHTVCSGVTNWADFAQYILTEAKKYPEFKILKDAEINSITSAGYPTNAARPKNSVLNCAKWQSAFGIAAPDWKSEVDQVLRELAILRSGS